MPDTPARGDGASCSRCIKHELCGSREGTSNLGGERFPSGILRSGEQIAGHRQGKENLPEPHTRNWAAETFLLSC